jgi:small subunit ribosomal protein S8
MSMVSTDPIADMLSRIRNAMNVNKTVVAMPHSKTKEAIATLLKDNHFINEVKVTDNEGVGKTLTITINQPSENARITEITRMSTPGRRMYTRADKIPTIMRGRGLVIVSTSQGLMTGAAAKTKHLGGEIICKVY